MTTGKISSESHSASPIYTQCDCMNFKWYSNKQVKTKRVYMNEKKISNYPGSFFFLVYILISWI